ncbi:histidine phosphatase family protein [Microbacterium marinilacus]|uniref:Histidine phosphatase family protein n=1 Tax=Microbacterium marinilacus TaxID=415209 RepID=A0ABP7B734_9MICO|nr:histidine phosphatase family protein [Microbacterium marinilacus]MBY0687429.1 histidine phosphatase family protein [Microbacterium marinilacus]
MTAGRPAAQDPEPTTLLLVRHGATAWTHERRLQGRTDIDLSDAGRRDVVELGGAVVRWRPRSIVASPLLRARTTAGLLADALGAAGIAAPRPVVDEDWAEHGLGTWEGLTPEAVGADYARWRAGEIVPPGGETRRETRDRVGRAVRRAAALSGPVLVVTHGGTIRAALAGCIGLTADRIHPVAAPSLTVLDVPAAGAGDLTGGRLRQFNAV